MGRTKAKLIAYRRVSTARQGESGLGLEAQDAAVASYAQGNGAVVRAYTEVETGKRSDRPELREHATDFFAVRVVIPGSLKILDLMKIEEGVEHEILSAVLYSSLLSRPLSRPRAGDDFERPQYVFSRFVADCARAAGFDGICYPSTRISKGHNLVLLAPVKPLPDLGLLEEVVSFDGNTVTVLRADG